MKISFVIVRKRKSPARAELFNATFFHMTQLPPYQEEAERFAAVARQYCALIESAETLGKEKLFKEIYLLLPLLISEAQGLPAVLFEDNKDDDTDLDSTCSEPDSSVSEHTLRWRSLCKMLGPVVGEQGGYWMTFDPRKESGQVHGDLDDDLADIYLDIQKGLEELPDFRRAIFDWRVLFSSHWGKHAIDALHVLHWYRGDAMLDE
jgi:hypothetical protein